MFLVASFGLSSPKAKIASADFPRVRGTKSDTFVTATSLEAARASVGGDEWDE